MCCWRLPPPGRPLITSDISGCREAVEDGNSGYLRPAKDANALYGAMQRVISCPWSNARNGAAEAGSEWSGGSVKPLL